MNVYDFDKTIYKKDSSVQFYLYCLKKKPSLIRYIFIQLWCYLKYVFSFTDRKGLKEGFFCFLKGVKDIDAYTNGFWKKNKKHIDSDFLKRLKNTDVILSSSPEFLIESVTKQFCVKAVICSAVDKKTGKISFDCYGEEKAVRFEKMFGEKINEYYFASLNDCSLLKNADKPYIVKGKKVTPFADYKEGLADKINRLFFAKEFAGFLIVGGINAFNGVLFASLFGLIVPDANISFILGYIVSLTISYILNSLLVFKHRLNFLKYLKFCISYVPNFLIQNGLVLIFYNLLGLNKTLVYIIAVIIAIPITFIALKIFTFKKR